MYLVSPVVIMYAISFVYFLLVILRDRVAELEIELTEVQRQKDILEARIEQRHLQVGDSSDA